MGRRKTHDRERIVSLYSSGLSVSEVALQMGIKNKRTIHFILKRENVELRPHRQAPLADLDGMVELYLAGKTSVEAAAHYGHAPQTCVDELRRRGIEVRDTQEYRKTRPWSASKILQKDIDKMIELYLGGASTKEAAASIGYGPQTCLYYLRKRGVHARGGKQSFNEHFFDVIDTEEKAYILGFITADGCVLDNGVIQLALAPKDRGHLQKILDAMGAECQIHDCKNGDYMSCKITLCSQHTKEALAALGVAPRKTWAVEPCAAIKGTGFEAAYWRGVFDGDGCITTHHKYPDGHHDFMVSLTGNRAMCEGFLKYVQGFTNTKAAVGRVRENTNAYDIKVGGNHNVRKIVEWLYSGATIYLDRKKELAERIINQPARYRDLSYITDEMMSDAYTRLGRWNMVAEEFGLTPRDIITLRRNRKISQRRQNAASTA